MRLHKLKLSKYGMFTGKVLDFGERVADQPDFHIIYGLNESGKTTSLEAWLDFLFGIKRGSPYGFKHSTAMEIQAVLEREGAFIEYKRVRKMKDSLKDASDEVVPDAVLHAHLGGYTRPDYEILFTANDQTLEKGGNEILASKGDLGKLLFSASAGMADLSERLQSFQLKNDQFYRKGTSKNELKQINQELTDLKRKWQEKDKGAGEYKILVRTFEEAKDNLEKTRHDLAALKSELAQVERKTDALRWVASLTDTQNELEGYEGLPVPPKNWRESLDNWGQEMIVTRGRLDQLSKEIDRMQAKLSENIIDEKALVLEDKVFNAGAQEAAYLTVIRDLPRRITRKTELRTEIEYLTNRLGLAKKDLNKIIPDSATIGLIRDLMQENSGLVVNFQTAEEEMKNANQDVEVIASQLKEDKNLNQEVKVVESILKEIRKNDPRTLLGTIDTDIIEADGEIERYMSKLHPWEGSKQDLVNLESPSKRSLGDIQNRYEELRRTYQETSRRIESLEEEISVLEGTLSQTETSHVTLEDIAEARNQRENQWVVHKSSLDMTTAEQFELAMRKDDHIASRVAEQQANKAVRSERMANLQELRRQLEIEVKKGKTLTVDMEEMHQTRKNILQSIPGLKGLQSIQELVGWLELRDHTLGLVMKLKNIQARKNHYEGVETNFKKNLALALTEAKIECKVHWTLETMIATAEDLIENHKEIKALRNQLLKAELTHHARLKTFEEARSKTSEWDRKWKEACERTEFWGKNIPQISEMKEIMATLDDLIPKVSEQTSLMERIEKMKEDKDRFKRNVEELAQTLDIKGTDTQNLWKAVESQVKQAIKLNNDNNNIRADLENRKEEQLGLEEDLTRINQAVEEFGKMYGKKNLDEIKNSCERAEKYQQLKSYEEKALENIRETMGLPTRQEAIEQLRGLELITLDGEKSRLESKIKECESELEDRFASQREARKELDMVSGDDSIARLKESYENLLIEFQEKLYTHLKNKFGIIALEQAIKKFRDTHKSDMMTLASDIFAKMSCGHYQSLSTALDKGKEILTVEPKEGGTKFAHELSKGTRFQLYLSLRIAGFYEIIKSNKQAPFLADDILETFDNDRTAEALKILEEMGKSCQVVYFTHHKHILDIAERVCPNATIHILETAS